MWRDIALSFSLANLVLLRVWGRVVFYGRADAFFMKQVPGAAPVVAATLNMTILAVLFWAVLRLARSSRRWIALTGWLGLLAGMVAALNSVRAILFGQFPRLRGAVVSTMDSGSQALGGWGVAVLAAVGLVPVSLLFLFRTRFRRLGGVGLLCLSPLAPLTLVGAAGRLMNLTDHDLAEPPRMARTPAPGAPSRVVWVIFDEWDYLRAFEARPEGLRTPHLDQLAGHGLVATQAHTPATATVGSVASLLEGEVLESARPVGPAELLVRRDRGGTATRWNAASTVLARARKAGVNTAVAGWYLPYCRLLAPVLNDCFWCEMNRADASGEVRGTPVARAMAAQMRSLIETTQHSVLGRSQGLEGHMRSYEELLSAGLRFAADPQLGFVFLHLPVPHAPYLGRDVTGALGEGDYATSLALVDEAVGRLEDAMRSSGVWGRTHLLLSADHSLRAVSPEDRRVPFVLRLAGDDRRRRYTTRLETVASADLLLAALRGEVSDHDAAIRWLDSRQ